MRSRVRFETFAAEATRLPCVNDVIIGAFGKHTPEYYERILAGTELALAWAPHYAEALDARGMALVHLGRLKDAEVVMKRRLEADPEAYPAHANLGTLYTFSGDYDAALADYRSAIEYYVNELKESAAQDADGGSDLADGSTGATPSARAGQRAVVGTIAIKMARLHAY